MSECMELRSADPGVSDDWRTACEGALSRATEAPSTLLGRVFRRFSGVVAALAVTAILMTWGTTSDSRTVETFVADVGEVNPIHLPDGSVVTLNTDTVVRLSHESDVLHFELLRGEVLFDMAANPNRRLLVSAADVSITEAGTTFAVRMVGSNSIWVTVESGAVFLVSAHTPRTLISKNEQVALTRHDHADFLHTAYLKSEDVKDQLAWRTGEIVFKNATLADAAQEFSRYSRKVKIEVLGRAASVQVGGAFSASDPLTFAQSVVFLNPEVSLEIDKRNSGQRILRLSSVAAARR